MERFISSFPKPSKYQQEILTYLIEECSEVIHRGCKLGRFGIDEAQRNQELTNGDRLGNEIGDLLEVIDSVLAAGLTTEHAIEIGRQSKRVKLEKYLQNRPDDV